MAQKKIEFVAEWIDKATPQIKELEKRLAKLEGQTRKTGKQTEQWYGAMTGKAAGQKLSRFNESTERMRQVTMLGGTAMSTAAGQAIYYSGTLSAMVGKLSVVEWGIMGVGAAALATGFIVSKLTQHIAAASKELATAITKVEGLEKSLQDATVAAFQKALGLSEATIQARKLQRAYNEVVSAQSKIGLELKSLKAKFGFFSDLPFIADQFAKGEEKLAKDMKKVEKAQEGITDRIKEYALALKMIKDMQKKEEKEEKGVGKARAIGIGEMDEAVKIYRANVAFQKQMDKQAEMELKRAGDVMASIEEQNWQRRIKITENALKEENRLWTEADRQLYNERKEMLQSVADVTTDILMAAITAEEGAVMAAVGEKLKAYALESTWLAVRELAFGFGSLFFNPAEAAGHFQAAALHTAFAVGAGAVGGAMGGGGGGTGGGTVSTGERARAQQPAQRQQEQQPSIINMYIDGHFINTKPRADEAIYNMVESYKKQRWPGKPDTRI